MCIHTFYIGDSRCSKQSGLGVTNCLRNICIDMNRSFFLRICTSNQSLIRQAFYILTKLQAKQNKRKRAVAERYLETLILLII